MKVPIRRGDLDTMLRDASALANLPSSAAGFDLECSDCHVGGLLVDYEGGGVLRIRCPRCRNLVALIAIAEGRAASDEELRRIPHRAPRAFNGRNN